MRRGGLDSIEDQVVDRAAHLIGVKTGRRFIGLACEADTLRASQLGMPAGAAVQKGTQCDELAARLVAFGHRQQPPQDHIEAPDLLQDHRERLGFSLRIAGEGVFGPEPHRSYWIADLMRDAGGKATDRSKPLAASHLTAELIGSLTGYRDPPPGLVQGRHDTVQLALAGRRQRR